MTRTNHTLFVTAWMISRFASHHFGGSPREYFAEALRMAYNKVNFSEYVKEIRTHYNDEHFEISDMPALTGSPRQIAWASEIRQRMLQEMRNNFLQSCGMLSPESRAVNWMRHLEEAAHFTSASWWIENRNYTWRTAIMEYIKASGRIAA